MIRSRGRTVDGLPVAAPTIDVVHEVPDLPLSPSLARLGREQFADPIGLVDLDEGVVGPHGADLADTRRSDRAALARLLPPATVRVCASLVIDRGLVSVRPARGRLPCLTADEEQ